MLLSTSFFLVPPLDWILGCVSTGSLSCPRYVSSIQNCARLIVGAQLTFIYKVSCTRSGLSTQGNRLPEADPMLRAEADASTALSCLLSTPGVLTPFPHLTLALTPASHCYPSLGPHRPSLVLCAAHHRPGLLEVEAISRQGSGLDFCSRLSSTTSHCPFSLPRSSS